MSFYYNAMWTSFCDGAVYTTPFNEHCAHVPLNSFKFTVEFDLLSPKLL